MTTTEQRLADALRAILPFAERDVGELAYLACDDDSEDEAMDANADVERAREALAAYDAQQAQAPLWTVFIRDEDNTGTTYITCVAATDLDAAKGLASAQCRDDWGYEEDAPLHILGVIEGDIGAVIEWDDCE